MAVHVPNTYSTHETRETIIDLNLDHYFTIDGTVLTDIVKEKNLDVLQQHGGADGIATALQTNAEYGIGFPTEHGVHCKDDTAFRQQVFGFNTDNKPQKSKGIFLSVKEISGDLSIVIFLVCAILSLGFDILQEKCLLCQGNIVLAVFVFIIPVYSILNYWLEKRQYNLSQFSSNGVEIEVVRSGRRQQISAVHIVVGDIICLKTGDEIPADGLFLDGHSFKVYEPSITGESHVLEINKNSYPFLFSGAMVVDGYAKMVVTAVGTNTTRSQLMSPARNDDYEETSIQARLNKPASSLKKAYLASAFLVLVVLLIHYFTGNKKDENGNREFQGRKAEFSEILNGIVGIIADALTIVVLAVPDLAVTLIMGYSMKKMVADQVMMKKLSACETMGSATAICICKDSKMTVSRFWLGQQPMEEGYSYSSMDPSFLRLIQEGLTLNNTVSVKSDSEFEFAEETILSWGVTKLNMEMVQLMQNCSILGDVEAFDSKNKISRVSIRRSGGSTIQVHWKGAAEIVLKMCSRYYDAPGVLKDLDDNAKRKFKQIIQGIAAGGLHCVAFATKQIAEEENQKLREEGLSLLGIVSIKNPCGKEFNKAVEAYQKAGINVKMITSDNVFAAKATATECGILQHNQDTVGVVVEGEEFRNYTREERLEKVDKICVMAVSSPYDKALMVKCLKEKGHIVAVTGDDANDAPALKEAHIGLSMGIEGTKVVKESSDIVILDDNFSGVVKALIWGRCVYGNIQKFIQYQLTMNIAALTLTFVAAVSTGEVPLKEVQLLWVKVVVDTLVALALATKKPSLDDLIDKPQVSRTGPLITNVMWRDLVVQALYQITILLTLQFKGKSIFDVTSRVNYTLIFNTFVLCQVFNVLNARKLEKKDFFKGFSKSKEFLGILGMILVLQVVIIEFLYKFAEAERLKWVHWGVSIGIAALGCLIGHVVKWLPIPEKSWWWKVSALYPYRNIAPLFHEHNVIDDRSAFFLSNFIKKKDKGTLLHEFEEVNGVVKYLKTDARKGINGNHEDIARRQKEFGYNRHHKLTRKNFSHFAMSACKDPVVMTLMVSALLCLVLNIKEKGWKDGWHNGGGILIVLLVVVTVSSVTHAWSHCLINKFSQPGQKVKVEVMRNGKEQQVSISNIVVGDIVCLKRGSEVPADGLFLHGDSLRLDESSLGEENSSTEVDKLRNPFLFCGSKVQSGNGKMLVTSVGENTKWAEIMSLLYDGSHNSISLKRRLKRLSKLLCLVGSVVLISTWVVLIIRNLTSHVNDKYGEKMFINGRTRGEEVWRAVVGIQVSAVTVASSAIPEGLPLAIGIIVAYTMKRMMNIGVLPRRFSACETLALVTTICLSTTGMTLQRDHKVKEAVQDCKKAGVSIQLLTRDDVSTAKDMASKCGILDPLDEDNDNGEVMEAFQFRSYTEEERLQNVEKIRVLAKASSADKLLFVQCLREKHHVVAVTGCSADDVQALKGADVGLSIAPISLDSPSSAVENSDIIVLSGSLVSAVAALQVGRCIYADIKVFIQFLFAANITSLVTEFASIIFSDHPPTVDILAAVSTSKPTYTVVVQIMWVKLIVGTLCALALVADKGDDIMQKLPTKPGQPLISRKMWKEIIIQASLEIAILLTWQFKGEAIFDVDGNVKDTMVFNIFVLFRIFAVLKLRKPEGNMFCGVEMRKLCWGILSVILALQILMVELLLGVKATKGLNWWQWGACIGIAFMSWPISYLASKCIPLPKETSSNYMINM